MPQPAVIREAAYAKVNLSLRVLGRRPDGYHELESLVAFAQSAPDEVEFLPGAESCVSTTGRFAGNLSGENIVTAALRLVAEVAPQLQLGAVRLIKNLPVAAGIGGGSADAAAVLRAIRAANEDSQQRVDWMAISARLGADVPVCFESRASLVRGFGDDVSPLRQFPPIFVVLVNAMSEMPSDKTAQVFKSLAVPPYNRLPEERAPLHFSSSEELIAHMEHAGNDLSEPATTLAPHIAEVTQLISATDGCRHAALSGAGPTCFGVYLDLAQAEKAARVIAEQRPPWWVLASVLR